MKHEDPHVELKLLLVSIMLFITVVSLTVLWTHGCSLQPRQLPAKAAPLPPPPPPPPPPPDAPKCPDGSALGSVRTGDCTAPQTGQITQVCTTTPTETAPAWVTVATTCVTPPPPPPPPPPPTCGKTAFADIKPTLQTYCTGCHAAITTYGVAQPWAPEMARRVGLPTGDNNHMPLTTAPQPDGAAVALIEKWAADGAILDCTGPPAAPFIDLDYQDTQAVNDAIRISPTDRPFTRYVFVGHAIDAGLTGPQVNVWVQALNKAMNGLNEATQDVVAVTPVDPLGAVWRVDLRSFGIGVGDIAAVDAADPFLINDQTSKGLVLQSLLGSKKPWWHLDNLLDITYRNSAVYYQLVGIPATLAQLQALVGVDFQGQLQALTLNFIGGDDSPIAEQKYRLITRAALARSLQAPYWQTFDVNATPAAAVVAGVTINTKNLTQAPLLANAGGVGVSIENFTPDASEVIYELPNGLHAYGLFDGAGNRLNAADPGVVIDTATPVGNHVINAANSCTRCHNGGFIPMVDQIRGSVLGNGLLVPNDIQLAETLYQPAGANAALFTADNRRYAAALGKIGVSPLSPDPQNVVTDAFLLPWNEAKAASFLFLTTAQFETALRASPASLATLAPLLGGGSVPEAVFVAAEPQLVKDARLFQDPLGTP